MDGIDHVMSDDGRRDACDGLRMARVQRKPMKSRNQRSEEEGRERAVSKMQRTLVTDS